MAFFSREDKDQHVGSGLDKPKPKPLLEKVAQALTPAPTKKTGDVPIAPADQETVTPPVAAAGSD